MTSAAKAVVLAIVMGLTSSIAVAQTNEIRLGQSMPYSGPASAWGTFGKTMSAYFDKVNADGGINGRKVKFMSYDDAYTPAKALEQTRRLVEQDNVLAIFGTGGTAINAAIAKYLNSNKVPQLFAITGAQIFANPKTYPWTIGWQPTFDMEARIYAKHALSVDPNAKIGVLYQNDDFGRDYLKAVQDVLGEAKKSQLVAASSYEGTDPSVDTNIITIRSRGATVLITAATPKFAAQAIKKAAEIGWKPNHYIYTGSASISAVFQPAGLAASQGVMTGAFLRDPSDPDQQKTKEYQDYAAFMQKFYADGKASEMFNVFAYSMAQTMQHVLRQSGNDLSRENLLRQATSIKGLKLPMLLPGITVDTSQTDYRPIQGMQLQRFDGTGWRLFGSVING